MQRGTSLRGVGDSPCSFMHGSPVPKAPGSREPLVRLPHYGTRGLTGAVPVAPLTIERDCDK